MHDAIMHEHERVHYQKNHGITYHICMHVDHLHREIFRAKCWEFRPLCDKDLCCWYSLGAPLWDIFFNFLHKDLCCWYSLGAPFWDIDCVGV